MMLNDTAIAFLSMSHFPYVPIQQGLLEPTSAVIGNPGAP